MPYQIPTKRRLLAGLIATLTATAFAANVHAGGLEPLQRLGRTLGCGWGDGYHACNASGLRPGADLPPRSFPKQFDGGCGLAGGCSSGGYYDQFDAQFRGNAGGCAGIGCDDFGSAMADYEPSQTYVSRTGSHSRSACDSPNCSTAGCDGVGCDSGFVSAANGQQWYPQPAPQNEAGSQYGAGSQYTGSQSEAYRSVPQPSNWNPNSAMSPATEQQVAPQVAPQPTAPQPSVPQYAQPKRPTQPTEAESNGDDVASPSDARSSVPADGPLRLPELGSTVDEGDSLGGEETSPADASLALPPLGSTVDEADSDGSALESMQVLPPPKSSSQEADETGSSLLPEAIPSPNPDPNTDADTDLLRMPTELGPLDASHSPANGLPNGWTEKPISSNPYASPDGASPVSLPGGIPAATPGDDDDLLLDDDSLLFESASLPNNRLPSTRPASSAAAYRSISPQNQPAAYGQAGLPQQQSSLPQQQSSLSPEQAFGLQAPRNTPPRSMFITQPE